MIHDGHIGIPFDIVDLRILGHQVIDDGENEVLHLGISHIEHHLRAATSKDSITFGGLDDPVGMFFIEFRDCV